MSQPTPELIETLYVEGIRAARRMSPEQKLRLSGELFDEMCERMRDGIRFQFPDADEARVEQVLCQRLEIARRLEEVT